MTNITAILDLFRSPAPQSTRSATHYQGAGIRGPFPYDSTKETPEFADPQLMKVLGEVELDARWAPVFGGDLTAYGSDHSRADLALCGELMRRGLSVQCTDTAMRASGLYREKWERDDYRAKTLQKAHEGLPKGTMRPSDGIQTSLLDLDRARLSISLEAPPPRDWFYSGMLVPGKSAILAGFGGTSKTQLAIQLAIATALGQPSAGRSVKHGSVMMICGEED